MDCPVSQLSVAKRGYFPRFWGFKVFYIQQVINVLRERERLE
jgi:hypothetical protein